MPPTPVREIGKFGIIKDQAPFDLPINAWSDGVNVLFQGERITSGPVFRNVTDSASIDSYSPKVTFVAAADTATGFDPILLATLDYKFYRWRDNALTDISPTVPGSTSDTARYTTTTLGGITYINREDMVPHYYDDLTPIMEPLTNWDSGWRCKSFRSYKDFGVAINVSKSGVNYPAMVKWSNTTLSNQVPPDWDETDLSSLAGENTLTDITGGLVDGGPLKNDFVIYSNREVYLMEFIGAPLVFSFRKLFGDDGAIAANCWVDVEGKHFVFGQSDIYVHDGVSRKSIADGRIRRYVFNRIDISRAHLCFAFKAKTINSVIFCYPTALNEVKFKNAEYCNEGVVYNYVNDTWSIIDLPNVTAAALANLDHIVAWDEITSSYENTGGSWADQEDSYGRHPMFVSVKTVANNLVSATRLIALDDPGNTKIAKPAVQAIMGTPTVERTGLSLESLGHTLDSRKLVSSLYPLVTSTRKNQTLSIVFGRHEFPDEVVTDEAAITFDPKTSYKVDTRDTGRFIGLKFTFPKLGGYYVSGFDIDVRRVSLR